MQRKHSKHHKRICTHEDEESVDVVSEICDHVLVVTEDSLLYEVPSFKLHHWVKDRKFIAH